MYTGGIQVHTKTSQRSKLVEQVEGKQQVIQFNINK